MKRLLFLIPILMFAACVNFAPASSPSIGTTPATISTFNASPSSISQGDTSTLTWTVSGATTVTIDQGIANVALSGNRVVAPTTSTIYTLTATNTAGTITTATTKIVVAPAVVKPIPKIPLIPLGKPDLIITNIWESGSRIHYRIKNQGNSASAVSKSVLLVETQPVEDDVVPSIAAGAALDREFNWPHFNCAIPILKVVEVRADTGNANSESDEDNNNLKEKIMCH